MWAWRAKEYTHTDSAQYLGCMFQDKRGKKYRRSSVLLVMGVVLKVKYIDGCTFVHVTCAGEVHQVCV